MAPVAVGLLLVPMLDHAVKLLLRHALGHGTFSLGPMGELRMVRADLWITRVRRGLTPSALWLLWIAGATAMVVLGAGVAWSGWWSGLLLGGSLSHAIEISLRGAVSDYVRLRFWPAFDLADVAIAAGACGLLVELVVALGAVRS